MRCFAAARPSRPTRRRFSSIPTLRSVRYTAAARSFDNQGWFLGTSGVGTLYLMDGAAIPERLTFGLPSPVVGAVLAAPDGIWAATQRTQQADAALTLVDPELKSFRSLHGLPATGVPFTQVRELAGQGTGVWAATDFGVARIETRDGRIDLVDVGRGLPDARVYAVASRQGRITVGTARGIARVSDSLTVERLAPAFSEAGVCRLSRSGIQSGWAPVGDCSSPCRASETSCALLRSRRPACVRRSSHSRRSATRWSA